MTHKDLIKWFEDSTQWYNNSDKKTSYKTISWEMEVLMLEDERNIVFVDYENRFIFPFNLKQVDIKTGALSLNDEIFLFGNGDCEYSQI